MIISHEKTNIIQQIKNLSDEENTKIAIFIAGMQAQKSIEPQDLNQVILPHEMICEKD